jgi:hypothetical protein
MINIRPHLCLWSSSPDCTRCFSLSAIRWLWSDTPAVFLFYHIFFKNIFKILFWWKICLMKKTNFLCFFIVFLIRISPFNNRLFWHSSWKLTMIIYFSEASFSSGMFGTRDHSRGFWLRFRCRGEYEHQTFMFYVHLFKLLSSSLLLIFNVHSIVSGFSEMIFQICLQLLCSMLMLFIRNYEPYWINMFAKPSITRNWLTATLYSIQPSACAHRH